MLFLTFIYLGFHFLNIAKACDMKERVSPVNQWQIGSTDDDAFEIGEDLYFPFPNESATTPSNVPFLPAHPAVLACVVCLYPVPVPMSFSGRPLVQLIDD